MKRHNVLPFYAGSGILYIKNQAFIRMIMQYKDGGPVQRFGILCVRLQPDPEQCNTDVWKVIWL